MLGEVSDRVGRKAVLVPMILLVSVLSAASGFAQDFHQLLLIGALLGLTEGPCWSVMMALVEENSNTAHRGRNIGIVVSAGAIIGLAIAPVLTTQVAAHYGWRTAFFVAGAPGLVLALLVALFVEEAPKPRRPQAARAALRADVTALLRNRNLWASAAGFMTWLFLVNAFGPLYITRTEHQSATMAGFLMGAAGLRSFFIGLIGPALSDRFGRRRVLAIQALLGALLPLALLTHGLYTALWLLAGILFLTQTGPGISAICIVLVPTESVPLLMAAGGALIVFLARDVRKLRLPLWRIRS